jgi:hypothetical protein
VSSSTPSLFASKPCLTAQKPARAQDHAEEIACQYSIGIIREGAKVRKLKKVMYSSKSHKNENFNNFQYHVPPLLTAPTRSLTQFAKNLLKLVRKLVRCRARRHARVLVLMENIAQRGTFVEMVSL